MSHSIKFFKLPITQDHLKHLKVVAKRDYDDTTVTVLKPPPSKDYFVKNKNKEGGKFMHCMIFVSGLGGFGVMSDKVSDESWEINYRKLRKI